MSVKKPNVIKSVNNPEVNLILFIVLVFQKRKANMGDRGNNIDGDPKIPCKLKGSGKTPAAKIENEKLRIMSIGIVLMPYSFDVL